MVWQFALTSSFPDGRFKRTEAHSTVDLTADNRVSSLQIDRVHNEAADYRVSGISAARERCTELGVDLAAVCTLPREQHIRGYAVANPDIVAPER